MRMTVPTLLNEEEDEREAKRYRWQFLGTLVGVPLLVIVAVGAIFTWWVATTPLP